MLAVHSLSATAPPSFIPAGVIEKEWFAETAQAFSCDPPPVAAVQAMIEIVHEINTSVGRSRQNPSLMP